MTKDGIVCIEKKLTKVNIEVIYMKLSELKKGEKGQVIGVNCFSDALKRRMLDMGVTEGVVVCVKKIAPFGDPVDIELRGYELCLRKSDLSNIEVKKL